MPGPVSANGWHNKHPLEGQIMKSKVYYGSPRQTLLEANETLPAKLDLIIEKLNIRERVKNESVVIQNAHRK